MGESENTNEDDKITMSATTKCMTKPSLSLPASRKAVNGRLSSRVTIKTRANATRRTEVSKVVEKAALSSAVGAAAIALAPAAQAAQEFAQVAEGEPLLLFSLPSSLGTQWVVKCMKVSKNKKKKN